MLTADAYLHEGEWWLSVLQDGHELERFSLETHSFPPVSSGHRLIERGYTIHPNDRMDRNRFAGWDRTSYGYTARLQRLEDGHAVP